MADPCLIINMALGEIGDLSKDKRMTAFSIVGCGQSAILRVAYDFYPEMKAKMLAAAEWSGTRKVKSLGTYAAADPVLDGAWSYKYSYPADCLMLRAVFDSSQNFVEYEVVLEENDAGQNVKWILCNDTDVFAKYLVDLGEEQYLPGMAELHALYIAEKIAPTAAGSQEKAFAIVQKIQMRAERLCKALGLKEGYVADERGTTKQYVDYF